MKNKAYFLIEDDLDLVGRWHLNGLRDQMGREFDSRVFTYGNYVELSCPLMLPSYKDGENCEVAQPVCVPLRKSGYSLDFTFADFDMPVLSERAANVLVEAVGNAVQRIP